MPRFAPSRVVTSTVDKALALTSPSKMSPPAPDPCPMAMLPSPVSVRVITSGEESVSVPLVVPVDTPVLACAVPLAVASMLRPSSAVKTMRR